MKWLILLITCLAMASCSVFRFEATTNGEFIEFVLPRAQNEYRRLSHDMPDLRGVLVAQLMYSRIGRLEHCSFDASDAWPEDFKERLCDVVFGRIKYFGAPEGATFQHAMVFTDDDHPLELPKGSLELVSILPEPGSVLTKESTLVATLNYHADIPDSHLSLSMVFAQFATIKKGVTVDGSFPLKEMKVIPQAKGSIQIEFPLGYVWDDKRVKRPIEVKFLMTYQNKPFSSVAIGSTPFILYE